MSRYFELHRDRAGLRGYDSAERTDMTALIRTLLAIVFIAAQVTALAHEFEHVLHQHEAPCALHVAADHLTMVTAPVPAVAVSPVPLTGKLSLSQSLRPPLRARSAAARAPPRLA